jgi:nucleoside-diphosphate-sugar epimerase
MAKHFVTGAAGFLGSQILLAINVHQVISLTYPQFQEFLLTHKEVLIDQ